MSSGRITASEPRLAAAIQGPTIRATGAGSRTIRQIRRIPRAPTGFLSHPALLVDCWRRPRCGEDRGGGRIVRLQELVLLVEQCGENRAHLGGGGRLTSRDGCHNLPTVAPQSQSRERRVQTRRGLPFSGSGGPRQALLAKRREPGREGLPVEPEAEMATETVERAPWQPQSLGVRLHELDRSAHRAADGRRLHTLVFDGGKGRSCRRGRTHAKTSYRKRTRLGSASQMAPCPASPVAVPSTLAPDVCSTWLRPSAHLSCLVSGRRAADAAISVPRGARLRRASC